MSVYVDDAFAGDWGKWTGGGHLQADARDALCPACRAMTGADRTIDAMAPLTRTQIEDRLREIDNDFASIGREYGNAAVAKVRAGREREVAIAVAYGKAEGNSTDKRHAAIEAVGMMGVQADEAYAKVSADFELAHERAMIGTSLLKSAGKSDEDPRYRS